MHAVDADIEVGAVGVGDRGAWSDWDNKVMAAPATTSTSTSCTSYGSNGDVPAEDVLESLAASGPDHRRHPRRLRGTRIDDVPIAVTEHNLVAFQDGDDERLMTQALNAFYLAETIGQMAMNGVSLANQWNLANGRADNGTDYGLIDAQTRERSPAYYAMALWSRFGDELVKVEAGPGLDAIGLYGGRSLDGSARLLVVNPSRPSSAPRSPSIRQQAPQSRYGRHDRRGLAALDKRHLQRVRDTERRPH